MKKRLSSAQHLKTLASTALLLASVGAQADLLGVTVGAYIWNAKVTDGMMHVPDYYGLNYDIVVEAEEANDKVLYIDWRHDIGYWPNLKASISTVKHDGEGYLDYGGIIFPITDGHVDMSHYDISAYWSVIDSVVRWDLGLTVRILDGSTGGDAGFQVINIPLSTTTPLLYNHISAELPLGFATGLEVMWGDYDDQSALDANLYASYTSPFGLGANLGYRLLNTDIETYVENAPDVDVFASMDFEGAYLGLFFNF